MRWYGNDVVVSADHEAAGYDGPEIATGHLAVRIPTELPDAFTAAEARSLAGSLLAAAAGLDKITRDAKEEPS